jgi:hypothetical protein
MTFPPLKIAAIEGRRVGYLRLLHANATVKSLLPDVFDADA